MRTNASERRNGDERWTEQRLKRHFADSGDVALKGCTFGEPPYAVRVILAYQIGMCDSNLIYEVVLPELERGYLLPDRDSFHLDALSSLLTLQPLSETAAPEEVDDTVYMGDLLLFFPEKGALFAANLANRPRRTPEESSVEISIKGPKDCFIEDVVTNVALIRKRIRSNTLNVENYILGKRTRTRAALLYIRDIANSDMLEQVRRKLREIDADGVYSINQLEEWLVGSRFKIFPLLDFTGRPDYTTTALLAGRFIIIVDGNPLVLVGPAGLSLILKSPEDVHFNYSYVSFARAIRGLSLFLSIFLPGIWVALASFHQDQIPFRIMATVAMSRMGLPFSSQFEMFILLMLLEIFREAGVRLPSSIGQTLTSIGGLIIGDAAIRAGLVSPSVVVVGAVTAVSGVTLVNQSLSTVVSILRLFFFLMSTFLGMYGVILGMVLLIGYLSRLRSFGVGYLAPLSPLRVQDLFSSFLRVPWSYMSKRPSSLKPKDQDRQDEESP
ncbi:spore germination protein [Cohnella sp. REN36]|uniref:spore germination protein n=1 Tax=Cohnella sp. REN36 TaxID=2887347 RepID=UPI001D15C39A|nr:spore germination protein [Cohnella sp. REN36]MCC3375345.1 spore germination protein [Cohnella sp. REN36]